MIRYFGGSKVESGWYVNASSLTLVSLAAEGTLPGTERDAFVRLPWPLLLAAGPVLGGLFVLALPVVGLSAAIWAIARMVAGITGEGARELAGELAVPPPAVGAAHLTGKPGEGEELRDAELEQLESEIRERRAKE